MIEKLEVIKQKKLEIESLKNELNEISQSSFDEFRCYIFGKYSQLESFGWTQYTPYFNDGDSTIFSANTDYLIINGDYVDESNWISPVNIINWGNWNSETKSYIGRVEEENKNFDKNLSDATNEIIDFLSNFDNDFYLTKFGDHAEITVTKSSVDISDYDHD